MNFFVVLLLTVVKATGGQFLEQPDLMIVFVPVQEQVTLTCSVEEGYIIDWRIFFPNNVEVDASNGNFETALMQRGFTLEGVATNRSTLSLQETETQPNNETNITCLAREAGTSTTPVPGNNTVTVIFYDAPPQPTDLSVVKNEIGFLNISWFLGFIEGVPVNYTLTVLNLNIISAQPLIIAGLLDQHYVFETSRPCDVYSFTVTAVTAAGNSTPSQELILTNKMKQTTLHWQTTLFSSTLPCPSTNDNSIATLITTVSVVVAIAITALVLMNVIVLACCYKKITAKVQLHNIDPVYETPGNVKSSSSCKDTDAPFAMTSSSAYGMSLRSHKLVADTKN